MRVPNAIKNTKWKTYSKWTRVGDRWEMPMPGFTMFPTLTDTYGWIPDKHLVQGGMNGRRYRGDEVRITKSSDFACVISDYERAIELCHSVYGKDKDVEFHTRIEIDNMPPHLRVLAACENREELIESLFDASINEYCWIDRAQIDVKDAVLVLHLVKPSDMRTNIDSEMLECLVK